MAKGIEEHLLNGEKIEFKTTGKLKVKEGSNFESGFIAYITNKRVILYKNKFFGFILHDIALAHLVGADVRRVRIDPMVLVLGIGLTLIGLTAYSEFSVSPGIFTALFGILLIALWFLKPIETLTLKGAGTEIKVRADSKILYDLLRQVRHYQK